MNERLKINIELFYSLYKEYGDFEKAREEYFKLLNSFLPDAVIELIKLNVDAEQIETLYDKYDYVQLDMISYFVHKDVSVEDVLKYINPDYNHKQFDLIMRSLMEPVVRPYLIEHLNDYFSPETDVDVMNAVYEACHYGLSDEFIDIIAKFSPALTNWERISLISGISKHPDIYSKWLNMLALSGDADKISRFSSLFCKENDWDEYPCPIQKIEHGVIDFWLSNSYSDEIERLVWIAMKRYADLESIKLFADPRLSNRQSYEIFGLIDVQKDNFAKATELKKCFLNREYNDRESGVLVSCVNGITKNQFLEMIELDSVADMFEQAIKFRQENMFSINKLFDELDGKVFSEEQSKVIFEAIHNGLPLEEVMIIADPELDASQMNEIRLGFEQWIDARKYAEKELSADRMNKIRKNLLLDSRCGFDILN